MANVNFDGGPQPLPDDSETENDARLWSVPVSPFQRRVPQADHPFPQHPADVIVQQTECRHVGQINRHFVKRVRPRRIFRKTLAYLR